MSLAFQNDKEYLINAAEPIQREPEPTSVSPQQQPVVTDKTSLFGGSRY